MQIPFEKLDRLRDSYRDNVIVYTAGCFDLLHTGHLEMLELNRDAGDVSVVGITPDEKIRSTKGPLRPIQPESTRLAVVDSLKSVDFTVLLPERVKGYRFVGHAVLKSLSPDILLTTDEAWERDREWVENQGTEIRYTERISGGESTTKTVDRLLRLYKDIES